MREEHSHRKNEGRDLGIVSVLNFCGFIIELIGGIAFGSVALISDAIHMLFDSLSYVMAYIASYVAIHYKTNNQWTYGYHRLEPVSAFINGLLLIPMVAFIIWESYQRFLQPIEIGILPTLSIAIFGLGINLVSVYILEGDSMSLNEKGAFYHLLGDIGGSIAVILSTIIIHITEISIFDPIVAVIIGILILGSALKVLHGSSQIFLHKNAIEIETVKSDLLEIDGVQDIDDIHTWLICSQITVATVQIHTDIDSLSETKLMLSDIHNQLEKLGIDHATVEICHKMDDCGIHLNNHNH